MTIDKQIELDLTTIDGNAFALMGAFNKAARREGWSTEEIDAVLTEAKSGEYNNLVATLAKHCK